MDDTQFIILILCLMSLGLLFINFFRVNFLFVLAAIAVNIGITQIIGAPKWLIYGAWLLAVGEAVAGVYKFLNGRKRSNKTRYTG